jgi:hypothetical protein
MTERILKRDAVLESLELNSVLETFHERSDAVSAGIEAVLRVMGGRSDAVAGELRQAALAIQSELGRIDRDAEVARRSWPTLRSMASTRDRPTESERIALFRMQETLDPLVRRFNAFLTGEVAGFREFVSRTEPDLFPPVAVIRR